MIEEPDPDLVRPLPHIIVLIHEALTDYVEGLREDNDPWNNRIADAVERVQVNENGTWTS